MSAKPNVATDTDKFKLDNKRLTLANKRLVAKVAALTDELDFAKAALVKIKAGYESRVSNTLKMDIQDILGCSDIELHKLTDGKSIEELEQMFENFCTATDALKSPYEKAKTTKTASIRPGVAAVAPGRDGLTVSAVSMYGKNRETILKETAEMT